MNHLRNTAVVLSLAAHVSVAYALTKHVSEHTSSVMTFDLGTGDDQFVVEQGIGLSSVVKLGEDLETIRTAEVTPVETVTPPPAVQETKPVEELQETITSTADKAPEDNIVKLDEPPPPETKPEEVKTIAAVEPPVQVAIARDASSGEERTGGNAAEKAAYLGKLVKVFNECAFKPKKVLQGSTKIQIVLDEQGKLVDRKIVTSSGDPKVDEAALANVDYAATTCKEEGLPPPPKGLTASDRTLNQTYNYRAKATN